MSDEYHLCTARSYFLSSVVIPQAPHAKGGELSKQSFDRGIDNSADEGGSCLEEKWKA
jgi:hypothetical protein